ncbi:MAG: hypothetical protein COV67_09065 [Nitrospinae bacterium CG11_big_fil_rev_8_21_14_0_20_56_8]|nr:MAG: hypothetical protein COV67_09065 [Nitrospinae bacterium CG11_big_fil_rev_8_21_14_0_20_56_8]
MKKVSVSFVVLMFLLVLVSAAFAENSVTITEPKDGDTVSSPVKVCMETHGVEVEPAKNGVNPGKGHHHLLVDVEVPSDLSQPVGKDANHIHMGDGSTCKSLDLPAGSHTITALFANGKHVPYDPAITAMVKVTVK